MRDAVNEDDLVPPGAVVVHPPYGFVHLQTHSASDLDVVNAARVSFNKQSQWEDAGDQQLAQGDRKVLEFLLKNKHGTPFEHTFFRFHVRAPIFVFREWHRHRIGISINEESARYVPLQRHFYMPDKEHMRRQTDKPGRYKFEKITQEWLDENTDREVGLKEVEDAFHRQYGMAYETYEWLIEMGVAKELARTVLPVGIYSQMIWCCNARSLMNFLALRNAETALREIREYAVAMEGEFERIMPVTHAAFVENNRVAP